MLLFNKNDYLWFCLVACVGILQAKHEFHLSQLREALALALDLGIRKVCVTE